MAIGIQGIDEGIFQELLDGDEDLFKTVISTFVNKTPGSLAKLASPTKETLADYAILVHAVKGACASICAEEARKKAFDLEQKARAGDLAGVQAGNGDFLKYAEELIVRLKDWLGKQQ
jgi:HPt (histidine-containing phosphotransfer) domain-containing protein